MAPRALPLDKVNPVFLKGGYLHLHYVEQRGKRADPVNTEKRFEWVVRERQHADICGTNRCVYLKIDGNQLDNIRDGVCPGGHDWGMPTKPTFKCKNCGQFAEADMAVREVKKGIG